MMITEKDKAKRILKEISGYFFDHGLSKFNLNVQREKEELIITIKAFAEKEPEDFQKLLKDLNVTRQEDIDEIFNALLGSFGSTGDYKFLGQAIDTATGGFRRGILSLEIIRKT